MRHRTDWGSTTGDDVVEIKHPLRRDILQLRHVHSCNRLVYARQPYSSRHTDIARLNRPAGSPAVLRSINQRNDLVDVAVSRLSVHRAQCFNNLTHVVAPAYVAADGL